MGIYAWVFDLGNTLMWIPEEHDEELCIQKVLGWNSIDDVRSAVYRICDKFPGQSPKEFIARFNSNVYPGDDTELTNALQLSWTNSVEAAKLKPDAHDILDCLKDAGQKIALVSNTPPTSHWILDRLDLRRRFDEIVFSCDVGYLKPDPRIFRFALDALDVKPEESVIVGDKIRTDILGGAILGMSSILVEERIRCIVENGQNYVDAIVPNLIELRKTSLFRQVVEKCR